MAARLAILAMAVPAALLPGGGARAETVVGWGNNSHWQLDSGYRSSVVPAPVAAVGVGEVVQVAAAYFTSYALLANGTVETWGGNLFGETGAGFRSRFVTQPVAAGLSQVTQIAAGGAHALALLKNGRVAAWGADTFGTQGNGQTCETLFGRRQCGIATPEVVPGLAGVVQVAAGSGANAALLAGGSVEVWGEDGQILGGPITTRPTRVPGLANVKQIALGGIPSHGSHLLALLGNGTVRALGFNQHGELGDGTTVKKSHPAAVQGLSGVAAISAGAAHNLALLGDGSVKAWGSNAHGQLGARTSTLCGGIPCATAAVSVPLRGVAAISAGLGFSLALRGGEVFAWGAGEGGQLGDGARADRRVPRPVIAEVSALCAGDFHALALFAGKPQTPAAELIPARRALTLLWRSSDSSDSWHVSWRLAKAGAPWEGTAVLAPAARSYQITGLRAGRTYEVKLASAGFPALILSGTPLPARQAKPRRRVSPRAAARSRPAAARR